MMKIRRNINMKQAILYFSACICYVLAFCSCAAPVYVKKQENNLLFRNIVSAKKIIILHPFITSFNTYTEAPVTPELCGATTLAFQIENSIHRICQQAGASAIIMQKDTILQNESAQVSINALESKVPVLMSHYRNKSDLMKDIQTLADATDAQIICASTIVVKVGAGGFVDPVFTGQVRQGTSTTAVKVILVSTDAGRVLWGNEMFVRRMASDNECIQGFEKIFGE